MSKIKKSGLAWPEWIRITLIPFVALILFYAVEDMRGYLALSAAKEQLLKEGFRLDREDYSHSGIPDRDNFAASKIFREIHSGNREFLREEDLPDPQRNSLSEINPHGFRGSDEALEDYFDPEVDRAEAISMLRKQLSKAESRMKDWEMAVARPGIDWAAVGNPIDLDVSLSVTLYQATRRAFSAKARLAFAQGDSASAAASVSVLLRTSRFAMTEQNLFGYVIGSLNARMSIAEVATGLESQIWNSEELTLILNDLNDIRENFGRKSVYEVEAATTIADSDDLWEQRKQYGNYVDMMGLHLLDLPDYLVGIDTEPLENFLNKWVYLIPRGWFWLHHADYLRSISSYEKGESWFQKYPLSESLFESADFEGLLRRIKQTEILVDFASLACELELFYLENDSYPAVEDFRPDSTSFRYTIGKNGRPVLWYSEDAMADSNLVPDDFEAIAEPFLWLYP
ncbi:MAG: hypothetical protein AAGA96_10465 [Verrucomicrobiota bacterium]